MLGQWSTVEAEALMKIAVVTPYFRESRSVLFNCHASVRAQRTHCTHVMVADGFPLGEIDTWELDHVVLPRSHGAFGSTPRLIGSFHAVGLGFDGVAFLDADNWYRLDHMEILLELHRRTGASIITSSRLLCRIDGTVMGRCPTSDGEQFVDTSCMLLMRPAFGLLANWCLMPDYAQVICDRVFWYMAKKSQLACAHSPEPTVYYRCGKTGAYAMMGETPPPGVQPPPDYGTAFRRWIAEGNPPLT